MGVTLKVNFEGLQPLGYESNEAYKLLRTNITFCGKDMKVIVITSTNVGEGKTEIAFQLSRSLADAGNRVVFIEGDLRNSSFVLRYQIDRAVRGLTHYLTGEYELEDVLYRTNLKELSVIFAGPPAPNPTELLGKQLFTDMIDKLRQTFDYIIFDSPSIGGSARFHDAISKKGKLMGGVIDSAILASKCDGAIIVIEPNVSQAKLISFAKKQLEKSGCSVLGAVLNKTNHKRNGYYGYSGRYHKYDCKY